MSRLVGITLVFIASAAVAAEPYPGPWRDLDLGLTRALIANKVAGCGSAQSRLSATKPGEHLVYCSSDGKRWTAYLVQPDTRVVIPHALIRGLKPPHDD